MERSRVHVRRCAPWAAHRLEGGSIYIVPGVYIPSTYIIIGTTLNGILIGITGARYTRSLVPVCIL